MAKQQPFELKGSLFTLTVLHLQQTDLAAIEQHLAAKVQQAPGFFQNIPVVIDLQALAGGDAPDFSGLISVLRRNGMIAVAARNGSEAVLEMALRAGLPALAKTKTPGTGDSDSDKSEANNNQTDPGGKKTGFSAGAAPLAEPGGKRVAPEANAGLKQESPQVSQGRAASADPRQSRLHGQPVRSGQQIYAQGTDLIVIGAVSPGAEVLADGSVHIYGPLRGRALAGVQGDTQARIFCQSLEAELVSIAGNYRILEEVDDVNRGRQMQIYLEQERLVIEPLVR